MLSKEDIDKITGKNDPEFQKWLKDHSAIEKKLNPLLMVFYNCWLTAYNKGGKEVLKEWKNSMEIEDV